jgi:hypothetical protein
MKRVVFVLVIAAVLTCAGPEASAGVGSQIGLTSGGPPQTSCGSGATLYSSSTRDDYGST